MQTGTNTRDKLKLDTHLYEMCVLLLQGKWIFLHQPQSSLLKAVEGKVGCGVHLYFRHTKGGKRGREESLFTFFSEPIGESSVNTHRAQTFILFPELSSALPGNHRELEDSLSRVFSAYCAGSFAHNSNYC